MPSLYPILLSIAIIGSLGVVYETYLAESVEDWFSELVERRREARRSRERKIRVEQGFEGNGGNENEGRKSWERERELDELVRREGLAGGKGPFEEGENEEERLMRRSWSGFAAESGSAGGGLLPGGGDQVRRRTNSRLGSRGGSDDQLDFGTLLKPLPNPGSVGTAPPQTHVLFTYSSPLPTPSALPPLPLPPLPPTTTTISSPLTNISTSSSSSASSSSSSASRSNNSIGSIHFPSTSSSFASLSLASFNVNSPLPSPSLLDRPPSTLVSTSWAHIPPSSSLHPPNPNDEGDDARSQTLTLRSGSTGLLVSGSAREGSISASTRSWAAGSVDAEEDWSARSSLDLGGRGSDVESVWSEGGFESGGSLVGSSLGGRGEEEEEEEEWSDVGSGSVAGGR